MTEMDMESIPKSITENGHTLRFADVEWKEANDEADYFESVIDSLSRAETDGEITAIKAELASQGYIKKGKR